MFAIGPGRGRLTVGACCLCGFSWPVAFVVSLVLQLEHSMLLEQVQQLEALRKDNADMAGLVAQLAMLRKDQDQLQELCSQVEVLRADNSLLRSKSQQLPALHEENARLQVRLADDDAVLGLLQACLHFTGMCWHNCWCIVVSTKYICQCSLVLYCSNRLVVFSHTLWLLCFLLPDGLPCPALALLYLLQAAAMELEDLAQQNERLCADVEQLQQVKPQVQHTSQRRQGSAQLLQHAACKRWLTYPRTWMGCTVVLECQPVQHPKQTVSNAR